MSIWEFLLFACWLNVPAFLLSADFIQTYLIFKTSFTNTIRVSNGLDPDQDQHYVDSTLGPNSLQR